MNDKNLHTNLNDNFSEIPSKGKIRYEKTEKEIWAELKDKIEHKSVVRSRFVRLQVIRFASAAVLFLLLGLSMLVLFYSKTVESLPGQHVLAELPDGSKVELNAVSSVKYYPLKWKFQRKVIFEGEAFFDVQKGKTFEVVSVNGTTRVLGTSFNVYARNKNYKVTCLSGKVLVLAQNESVTLEPNTHAEIEKGKLILKKNFETESAVSWKVNYFDFSGTPLKEVFDEIERQYAVTVEVPGGLSQRNVSLNFPKKFNVEEVLEMVCKSMQITFEKQSENVYLIKEKS